MNDIKNGIWQFEKIIPYEAAVPGNTGLPDVYTFVYDNHTLVLKMPSVSTSTHTPPHDVYRVQVKWKDDRLYQFPPFGVKWELFAIWWQDHFVMRGNRQEKHFKKITAAEIAPWNRELLRTDILPWQYDRPVPDNIT